MGPDDDWHPSDDFYDDFEDDEFEDFDCHLDTRTGQCGAAGSEWCEFDCPYRETRDEICWAIRPKARRS